MYIHVAQIQSMFYIDYSATYGHGHVFLRSISRGGGTCIISRYNVYSRLLTFSLSSYVSVAVVDLLLRSLASSHHFLVSLRGAALSY